MTDGALARRRAGRCWWQYAGVAVLALWLVAACTSEVPAANNDTIPSQRDGGGARADRGGPPGDGPADATRLPDSTRPPDTRQSPDTALSQDAGAPSSCNSPRTPCGSLCVDIANDSKHCGGCFRRCGGATDRCDEGQCVCGPNLQTCGPGQNCVEGACRCIAGGLCDGCCAGDRCLALGVTQSWVACGKAGETCASCDDGRTCTVDSCLGSGDCVNQIDPGFCVIGARCYPGGPNPKGACQTCDPNRSTTSWSEDSCVSTIAGSGAVGLVNGPASSAQFSTQIEVAHDAQGRLFIADVGNARIRMLENGQVTPVAGGGTGASYEDGPVEQARLGAVYSMAIGSDGRIYLADLWAQRVRVIDASHKTVTTLAGDGTYGYLDGPAASARFASPRGIAVDALHRVYVSDTNSNTIRMISGGRVTTIAGEPSLCLAACPGGCRVMPPFCNCSCGGFADGAAATAKFQLPWGLTVDPQGKKVYVADALNKRIRLIEGGQVSTFAGSSGSGNLDGPASLATFIWPTSVALNARGVLYVSDGDTYSIRRIAAGEVSTVAGQTKGYRDGLLEAALLRPFGLSLAPSGAIVFGDIGVVRQITLVP